MTGRKVSLLVALIGAALWSAGLANAAEFSVSQKGHVFSPKELKIKVGDIIVFVNDDNGTHNVFSTSEGNVFDLKAQRPGASATVSFAKTGVVDVRCAIHPAMKMVIKVE